MEKKKFSVKLDISSDESILFTIDSGKKSGPAVTDGEITHNFSQDAVTIGNLKWFFATLTGHHPDFLSLTYENSQGHMQYCESDDYPILPYLPRATYFSYVPKYYTQFFLRFPTTNSVVTFSFHKEPEGVKISKHSCGYNCVKDPSKVTLEDLIIGCFEVSKHMHHLTISLSEWKNLVYFILNGKIISSRFNNNNETLASNGLGPNVTITVMFRLLSCTKCPSK